ncbi:Uncharacterised protein [uncultured archaeon]|nr:Uncharacterised protein [uncultured archaeon]
MWKRNTFETKPFYTFNDVLENLEYMIVLVEQKKNK